MCSCLKSWLKWWTLDCLYACMIACEGGVFWGEPLHILRALCLCRTNCRCKIQCSNWNAFGISSFFGRVGGVNESGSLGKINKHGSSKECSETADNSVSASLHLNNEFIILSKQSHWFEVYFLRFQCFVHYINPMPIASLKPSTFSKLEFMHIYIHCITLLTCHCFVFTSFFISWCSCCFNCCK